MPSKKPPMGASKKPPRTKYQVTSGPGSGANNKRGPSSRNQPGAGRIALPQRGTGK